MTKGVTKTFKWIKGKGYVEIPKIKDVKMMIKCSECGESNNLSNHKHGHCPKVNLKVTVYI